MKNNKKTLDIKKIKKEVKGITLEWTQKKKISKK